MPSIASRLSYFTESIISEMTRSANKHQAINLSQGFPDFDPPESIVQAAHQALDGEYHQYASSWGAPDFRTALAAKQSRFMGLELDQRTNITVTCGSTEAMMAALMAVCNPGDKVILFSPFYENYGLGTILTGAEPIYVELHAPDFSFDPDELERAFKAGARAIVVCNPSNPTGRVFNHEELQIISRFAQEYDAFVITDEVYEHIVYEPHKHIYTASLPGMFERTLTCGSLSKTFAITGWRLGYVIAPGPVSTGVRKVHDVLTDGAPHPLQQAAAVALAFPDSYYEQVQADYARRKKIFIDYLDRAGLRYADPEGAFYVMVDMSEFDIKDDTAFCMWMVRNVGVAAVPGSNFYHRSVQNFVRFNYAKRDETLHAAGERLLGLRAAIESEKHRTDW